MAISVYIIHKGGVKYIRAQFQKSHLTANKLFQAQKTLFDIYIPDSSNILFVGNSIIRNCEWSELLPNPRIKNRGVDGIELKDILIEMDNITRAKAKKVFLLSGTNELKNLQKVDEIIFEYGQVVSALKNKTKLYILSCPPVNNELCGNIIDNNDIIGLNNRLENLCSTNKIIYIDIYSLLKDKNNQLDNSYTFDGIHLNAKGYLAIKNIIARQID